MIRLSAAYSKKVGLPGYSSHSFSVSIETELQNLDDVREESARLYDSLQKAVDQQIQKTDFVPPDGYGMEVDKNGAWNCSQKQRELIEKIGNENNLDQNALDRLAGEMFGAKVQALNKLQASGLSTSFGSVREKNSMWPVWPPLYRSDPCSGEGSNRMIALAHQGGQTTATN